MAQNYLTRGAVVALVVLTVIGMTAAPAMANSTPSHGDDCDLVDVDGDDNDVSVDMENSDVNINCGDGGDADVGGADAADGEADAGDEDMTVKVNGEEVDTGEQKQDKKDAEKKDEKPPADEKKDEPPADDEEPPADDEEPPADDEEEPPADDEEPPADDAPEDDDDIPVDIDDGDQQQEVDVDSNLSQQQTQELLNVLMNEININNEVTNQIVLDVINNNTNVNVNQIDIEDLVDIINNIEDPEDEEEMPPGDDEMNDTADINVTKNANMDEVELSLLDEEGGLLQANEPVTFTVEVTNEGPATAENVTVNDEDVIADIENLTSTTALLVVNSSTSQGEFSAVTGEFDVGTLEPGETATLTFDALAVSTDATLLEPGAEINATNVAELVESDPEDPNADNNVGSVEVTLLSVLDEPIPSPSPSPVVNGDAAGFISGGSATATLGVMGVIGLLGSVLIFRRKDE